MLNETTTETETDAELACLVRLERRSVENERSLWEREMAQAAGQGDMFGVKQARREIARCDQALNELYAGRLPA